jgi:CheY-like chemotaxis protein
MQRLLQLDGHEVEIAGDIVSATEALAANQFDLLISDLGLPDGSGLDLLRRLRRRGSRIPAIALSGYGQEQDIQRSHDAGFTAHLTKPANPDHLRQTITRIAAQK